MGTKFFNKKVIIVFIILLAIANILIFTIPLTRGNKIRVNQTVSTLSMTSLYQINLECEMN